MHSREYLKQSHKLFSGGCQHVTKPKDARARRWDKLLSSWQAMRDVRRAGGRNAAVNYASLFNHTFIEIQVVKSGMGNG